MAQVYLTKVLERMGPEVRVAMDAAVRTVAPDANIDARALVEEFIHSLASQRPHWVIVPDSYVRA